MTFFKLYLKTPDGYHYVNHYFNQLEKEHPLATARRMLLLNYDRAKSGGKFPDFKKLSEGKWRLNGTHTHPFFTEVEGVWYVEREN